MAADQRNSHEQQRKDQLSQRGGNDFHTKCEVVCEMRRPSDSMLHYRAAMAIYDKTRNPNR